MSEESKLLSSLRECGVDVDDGTKRLGGNPMLYERLLKKFPDAIAGMDAVTAIKSGNIQEAIQCTHTLKGLTGNLSLTPLYTAYSGAVAALRAGDATEALCLAQEAAEVQEKIIACIVEG